MNRALILLTLLILSITPLATAQQSHPFSEINGPYEFKPNQLVTFNQNLELNNFDITNAGWIGIGKTPTAELDVNGEIKATNGLTITGGTITLPNNQIDSSEVNFNYAASTSKGGAATNVDCINCIADNEVADTLTLGPSSSVNKGALSNAGTLSFDWSDAEISNTLTIGPGGSVDASAITGNLETALFDAYQDLQDAGRLNNDDSSDLLTQSQLDNRFASLSGGETINGAWTFNDDVTFQNDIFVGGEITYVNSETINVNGSIIPPVNNMFDLGSSDKQWAEVRGVTLYQNGNQVLDSLTAGTGISITGTGNTRTITSTLGTEIGSAEISSNAVGDDEINYGQVTLNDFTNDANFITDDTNVPKGHLSNSGTLGFDWSDTEISDSLTIGSGGSVDNAAFSARSDLSAEGYLDNNADGDLLTRSQLDSRFLGLTAKAADADKLDNQDSTFYRNADNINAGTLSVNRYSAYGDLSNEGKLDNNHGDDLLTRSQLDSRFLNVGEGVGTTVEGSEITDGTITDVDLAGTAAISGSKVNPDFGSQDIVTTGSVGIGTDSPGHKLEVSEISGTNAIRVSTTTDTNGDNTAIEFTSDNRFLGKITGTRVSATDGELSFTVRDDDAGVETMVLRDGNVGIGTNNPISNLHIADSTVPTLELETTSSTNNNIQLVFDSVNAPTYRLGTDVTTNNGGDNFELRSDQISGPVWVATPNGNLGIGTANPAQKLHVVGNVRIAGQLDMNSNRISNLDTPSVGSDAATKQYVDDATQGSCTGVLATVSNAQNQAFDIPETCKDADGCNIALFIRHNSLGFSGTGVVSTYLPATWYGTNNWVASAGHTGGPQSGVNGDSTEERILLNNYGNWGVCTIVDDFSGVDTSPTKWVARHLNAYYGQYSCEVAVCDS